jgi:HTH-type transcriptional regulator/antitoxin HigA
VTVDIKPIKNDKDNNAAIARVEALWNKKDQASRDELEILGILISKYEEETMPIGPSDPIDMLKFCMEQQELSQADLSKLLGSRSRSTEILNRKRPLTLDMIRSISAAWNIPVELLVGKDSKKAPRRAAGAPKKQALKSASR